MVASPALERVLRRDRIITLVGLIALCALAWIYTLVGAGLGMSALEMTTLALFPHQQAAVISGVNMAVEPGSSAWSATTWTIMIAMWWIMMIAMMTPSAAPTVLLYARVHGHAIARSEAGAEHAPTAAFVAGYLLVWLAFSIVAAALHWSLERTGFLSAMFMGSRNAWLSGAVLIFAGAYQLSPLKNVCLAHCRAPASFLSRHWRPGAAGAVRLGILHGTYCVGCCWLLMALLFVGGVMNLAWIAALALLIMIEKVLPLGAWVGRAAGVALIAWGIATLLV